MRYENVKMEEWIANCDKSAKAKSQAELALSKKLNCMMIGNVGTGKTMLANCMANSSDRGVVATCSKIARVYREHVVTDKGKESDLMDIIMRHDFFAIDEIGAYKLSDFEYRHINEIIDMRYEAELPTCLISNLDVAGLKSVIGERAVDRIKHGGELIAFDWESKR